MFKYFFYTIFFVFFINSLEAQTIQDSLSSKVQIIKSELLEMTLRGDEYFRKLTGNVRLKHKDAFLLCDSAFLDSHDNISAYGHVVIIQGDSVNVFADSMTYKGSTRIADLYSEVVLRSGSKKLFTSKLNYNLATKVAVYNTRSVLTNDKTALSSNRGTFFVDENKAFFKDSVIVNDPVFSLKTDTMGFDTRQNITYFLAPTIILQDSAKIYCEGGFYDIQKANAQFVKNPQYQKGLQRAQADTILYDGKLKMVTLQGNAYSEEGMRKAKANAIRYDQANDMVFLEGAGHFEDEKQNVNSDTIVFNNKTKNFSTVGRSRIINENQIIDANRTDYNSETGVGFAEGDVIWTDTSAKTNIKCQRMDYDKNKNYIKATGGRPWLTTLVDSDSLWMRADTLISFRENPDDSIQTLLAYHRVRIFSRQFQAICDSLSYNDRDSLFHLFQQPMAWSDTSQFSGDTINIALANQKIDKIFLQKNAFIINSKDAVYFNQIKGRDITAFFENDELRRMKVEGNAESVYYATDDSNAYMGVNKSICSDMMLYFGDNQVDNIMFYTNPQATLTPMRQADHKALRIKGFSWQLDKKPQSKWDL